MGRWFGMVVVCWATTVTATAADVPALLKTIKAVGPEGAGSPEAARAWRELSQLPAADLPRILAAIDNASPAAANWLRSAVDAIAERERVAGRPLPKEALESFVRDTRHAGRARHVAYELLCTCDPSATKRLLPTMLDDPGAELRYEAVEHALKAVRDASAPGNGVVELRKLLSAARDGKQVEEIAKELQRRGAPVDLVTHFGFITRWQIAGVFDNTDGRGVQTSFPPEKGVDLSAKYPGKEGMTVAWRPVAANEKTGIVDLNLVFPDPAGKKNGMKAAVAYAYAEVDSPTELSVEVRAASATAIKAFINGREIMARESYHQSFERDMHIAPARLAKGRNAILLKVCQNDQTEVWAQNWQFQIRVTDNLGAAIPLTVVTPPSEKGR